MNVGIGVLVCLCVSMELASLQSGCEEGVGNGKELQRLQGQVGTLLRDSAFILWAVGSL